MTIIVTKERAGNTQLVSSSSTGAAAAAPAGSVSARAIVTGSLDSSDAEPGLLMRTVFLFVGVGPSSVSSSGGTSSRAVLPSVSSEPLGPTFMVAASVGLFSLIVFGPSPGFAASSAKADSSEMREVLRFSSDDEDAAGAAALIAEPPPPILIEPAAVAGLIRIVFGPSVALPAEIPGLDGAAISSGILDVSFFEAITVFPSDAGTAGATRGFGVNGIGAGAGGLLPSGIVIRIVSEPIGSGFTNEGGLIAVG